MHHPPELIHSMTIAHSQLLGWTDFALSRQSARVTTIDAVIMPIMKPVSSKCLSYHLQRVSIGSLQSRE
ncbi:hypothetical protein CCHR01_04277 [Colletotrichum chrysophilum]|uniref:Uncharacterized protein n=1 Tax=Colletotrichum chrysophilum TaxID=1836956 RepID=A0AAD9EIR5_9PEZI|nr:hypothetical protein CCHR01_04277 [Colletotrichum chrysophilum]